MYEKERKGVGVGMGSRAVDWKPRSREHRVVFHTICLGHLWKCDFLILDSSTILGVRPALDLVF